MLSVIPTSNYHLCTEYVAASARLLSQISVHEIEWGRGRQPMLITSPFMSVYRVLFFVRVKRIMSEVARSHATESENGSLAYGALPHTSILRCSHYFPWTSRKKPGTADMQALNNPMNLDNLRHEVFGTQAGEKYVESMRVSVSVVGQAGSCGAHALACRIRRRGRDRERYRERTCWIRTTILQNLRQP